MRGSIQVGVEKFPEGPSIVLIKEMAIPDRMLYPSPLFY